MRTIVQGEAVKEGGEELTLDASSHRLLWGFLKLPLALTSFQPLDKIMSQITNCYVQDYSGLVVESDL